MAPRRSLFPIEPTDSQLGAEQHSTSTAPAQHSTSTAPAPGPFVLPFYLPRQRTLQESAPPGRDDSNGMRQASNKQQARTTTRTRTLRIRDPFPGKTLKESAYESGPLVRSVLLSVRARARRVRSESGMLMGGEIRRPRGSKGSAQYLHTSGNETVHGIGDT